MAGSRRWRRGCARSPRFPIPSARRSTSGAGRTAARSPGSGGLVAEGERVPVRKHDKGLVHIYVDAAVDVAMAVELTDNAKTQRPGVCNAVETLLVHRDIAAEFLPRVAARLGAAGVELRGCPRTLALVPSARPARDEDWDTEYL